MLSICRGKRKLVHNVITGNVVGSYAPCGGSHQQLTEHEATQGSLFVVQADPWSSRGEGI